MRLFRNKDDEDKELAEEDRDKEEPVNQQLVEEAKRWKDAYEKEFKRANAVEEQRDFARAEAAKVLALTCERDEYKAQAERLRNRLDDVLRLGRS